MKHPIEAQFHVELIESNCSLAIDRIQLLGTNQAVNSTTTQMNSYRYELVTLNADFQPIHQNKKDESEQIVVLLIAST